MKRLLFVVAAGIAVVLLVTVFAAIRMNGFLHTPVAVGDNGHEFEIVSGTSFRAISDDLEQREIISDSLMFRLYARWRGQAGSVQAGDYLIEAGTTPAELLQKFTSGDVQLFSFTIIEGWNQWDLLNALHEHPHIDAELTDEDWPAFLEELGAADIRHPEGLFLPETYRFPRNSTDRDVLAQAYRLMQTVLAEEWSERASDAAVTTPYEALILASIVEKETALADERPRIAGVFTRRLGKRMRLQTDPTVIYGIGRAFNGNLTRKDLRTDTPYNTYTRRGLPPTPIAMPGRDAIHAALHPASGEDLYFVATGLGDGSHAFSVTKEQHDAAVAEYLRRLRTKRQ
jgi:UPF0755 protein